MHRISVIIALAACSRSSASENGKPTIAASGCPVITGVNERFAVGAIPQYGLPDMAADHGIVCTETFASTAALTKEGTFTGTCKQLPGERTYAAIKPARLALGRDLVLDSKTPDKTAWLQVKLLDRCGDELSAGATQDRPVPNGCDNVVKLRWSTELIRPREIEVVPVAAGTCTLGLTYLGVAGTVAVTVR